MITNERLSMLLITGQRVDAILESITYAHALAKRYTRIHTDKDGLYAEATILLIEAIDSLLGQDVENPKGHIAQKIRYGVIKYMAYDRHIAMTRYEYLERRHKPKRDMDYDIHTIMDRTTGHRTTLKEELEDLQHHGSELYREIAEKLLAGYKLCDVGSVLNPPIRHQRISEHIKKIREVFYENLLH